jgi:CRISPR-associated protein Csm5
MPSSYPKTTYDLEIEILSPLHIGCGTRLEGEIDFVVNGGQQTRFVNQDSLLDKVLGDDLSFNKQLLGRPASELLKTLGPEADDPDLFHYSLGGAPINRFIQAALKDVYHRAYIPGSTLKGLLRNLFFWGWYAAKKQVPDTSNLSPRREWASQILQKDVFGDNPNIDLFRALQISDTGAIAPQSLFVANVSIYPTSTKASPGVMVDVEALKPKTKLEARMQIDEYLLADDKVDPHWADKRKWFDRLVRFGDAFAGRRLDQELAYFQGRRDSGEVLAFYNGLVERFNNQGEGQFLAQLGWGSGWNSKTLNDLLMLDEREFARLVREYRLSKHWDTFQPGDRFPNSRHLVQQGGKFVRPMGWVQVSLKER